MAPRETTDIFNGRLCVARVRRSEIEVDVYRGEQKNPDELVGEWSMPKLLGITEAMRVAEAQTKRAN